MPRLSDSPGIDGLKTKGDLARFIATQQSPTPRPDRTFFPEIDTDPDAPETGALVWVISDNGSGKRELRCRFPTGAVQTLSTEP